MIKPRWCSFLALLLVQHGATVNGTLSIYHGQETFISGRSQGIIVHKIEGVAVLDLGRTGMTVNHFFDCNSTTQTASNLHWGRVNGRQRFPVSRVLNNLRLNMAPPSDPPAYYPDAGVYTCIDGATGAETSINITGGDYAIASRPSRYDLDLGGGIVSLGVYAAGNPPLRADEIVWYGPNRNRITSGGRFQLMNGNTILVISNVEVTDIGTYRIEICRTILVLHSCVQGTTTIELNIVVVPSSQFASEGALVQFQCHASRSRVRWTSEGNNPLPSGVSQVGNTLVIQSASRIHTGRYHCSFESITATVMLVILYVPTTSITNEQNSEISSNGVSVTINQGERLPDFSCNATGFPQPIFMWVGPNQGGTFPSGVITRNNPASLQTLTWNRKVELTDSGKYVCKATNSQGNSSTVLSLTVQGADPGAVFGSLLSIFILFILVYGGGAASILLYRHFYATRRKSDYKTKDATRKSDYNKTIKDATRTKSKDATRKSDYKTKDATRKSDYNKTIKDATRTKSKDATRKSDYKTKKKKTHSDHYNDHNIKCSLILLQTIILAYLILRHIWNPFLKRLLILELESNSFFLSLK